MDFNQIATIGVIAIPILIIIIIIASGYVKAPPDKAFIISGLRKEAKIVSGRAAIKIPFLERKDELSLRSISIDVKTENEIPTADYINITVDAVANIQIDNSPEGIKIAARNFLNAKAEDIVQIAKETLTGNLREIIAQMQLAELVGNQQKLSERVLENVTPDLKRMGINIVSFNIQNFSDKNGVIDDLGIDNVSQIQKTATIAKAKADKEVAIAKSEADKQANDARVVAELEMAKKNQELEIRKAELKALADVEVAKAEAAGKIQAEEERKKVEISTQNANIARAEKEEELTKQQVKITEQQLDSKIRKTADANAYADKQKADADKYRRAAEAEAERIEQEEAAKGIRAIGEANAEAIRLKGLAEAEAMEKKAEAYKQYTGAAITEMLISVMPQMAEAIAKPLSAIDKVTIIGGSNDSGISDMGSNTSQLLAKTFETIKEITGYDLTDTLKSNGYDAKTTKNINVTGLEASDPVVKTAIVTPEIMEE